MTMKLEEVANVKWTLAVLGDGEALVSARTYRFEPTELDAATHLIQYNYPRLPEHRKSRTVLVRTESRVERISVPSAETMKRAAEIEERRRGVSENQAQVRGEYKALKISEPAAPPQPPADQQQHAPGQHPAQPESR